MSNADRNRAKSDAILRARARREDARRQAAAGLMAGRTLATTPHAELTAEERAERRAETTLAFEGL